LVLFLFLSLFCVLIKEFKNVSLIFVVGAVDLWGEIQLILNVLLLIKKFGILNALHCIIIEGVENRSLTRE